MEREFRSVLVRESMSADSWLLATALSIGSSVDNFAVGMSVALAGRDMPWRVNAIIAACNASGGMVATAAGSFASEHAPQQLAQWLAAAVFFYLGYDEWSSWRRGEPASPLASRAGEGLAWSLAVPMTLSNLAGGAAGGAVGVGPLQAGVLTLLTSYIMCAGGARVGRMVGKETHGWLEPRLAAAAIFACVAGLSLRDALLGGE